VTIAITGLGAVCSIGGCPATFGAGLRAGRSGVRAVSEGYAAPLPDFDFEAALAGWPVELAESARRAGRRAPRAIQLAVIAACQAWQDARLGGAVPPERIGVVVAGSNLTAAPTEEQHSAYRRNPRFVSPRHALRMWDTDQVAVISALLGITGEGHTIGAASASGTMALVAAARLIRCEAVDVCLVVGATPELTGLERAALLNVGALAPPAEQLPGSPFDTAHRGFVPGEAAGCLVLERAESAERRDAPVAAWLAGWGVALDGNSLADPTAEGEARAIGNALSTAGIEPGDVDYVNTHGTGSVLGDRTELAALRLVLSEAGGRPWLNATKALTGHCLNAAGVIEAVATVLQLRDGFVHPNPGLRDPVEPGWRFAGPVAEATRVRTALSCSFGFGGFNAAVVLRAAA